MEIHVYDTYVKAKDGHTMHFDVFTAVKDDQKAIEYAKQWLTIGEGDAAVTSRECSFRHSRAPRLTLPMQSTRMGSTFIRWKAANSRSGSHGAQTSVPGLAFPGVPGQPSPDAAALLYVTRAHRARRNLPPWALILPTNHQTGGSWLPTSALLRESPRLSKKVRNGSWI